MLSGEYKISLESERAMLTLSPTSLCRILDGGVEGFDCPELAVDVRPSGFYDGGYAGERRIKPRRLAVMFEVTDLSRESEVRDAILRLTNPRVDCTITVTVRGRTRRIKAIPCGSPEYVRKNFTYPPSVRLCFIAEDPFFESVNPTKVILPKSAPALTFPASGMIGAGTVTGISRSLNGEYVMNGGDVECGFTAVLYASGGRVLRPGLALGNRILRLNSDLEFGGRAIFDTRKGMKSARADDGNNAAYDRNSEFFSLSPGENALKLIAVSGVEYLSAEIEFNEKFLGI